MYTATMIYPVNPDAMDDFVKMWEDKILKPAVKQPGIIRIQLLTRDNEAMALGTWTDKTDAEKFMSLGYFKDLMAAVGDFLTADPKPTIWSLTAFAES